MKEISNVLLQYYTFIYYNFYENKNYNRYSIPRHTGMIINSDTGRIIDKHWRNNHIPRIDELYDKNNYSPVILEQMGYYDDDENSSIRYIIYKERYKNQYYPDILYFKKHDGTMYFCNWYINGKNMGEDICAFLHDRNIVFTIDNHEIPDEYKIEFKLRFL